MPEIGSSFISQNWNPTSLRNYSVSLRSAKLAQYILYLGKINWILWSRYACDGIFYWLQLHIIPALFIVVDATVPTGGWRMDGFVITRLSIIAHGHGIILPVFEFQITSENNRARTG